MIEKIKLLISSIRFWIFTLGAISAYLALVELHGFLPSELFAAISAWLLTVGGTGSLDKWFEKKNA